MIRQVQDSPIGCAVCAKEVQRVLRVQKVQGCGAAQKIEAPRSIKETLIQSQSQFLQDFYT